MTKYWIITYGCQANKADSERIAANLEKKNYKPASSIKEADLIVINMCSVRQAAVDGVFGKFREIAGLKAKKPKLKTVLTGCIVKADRKKFRKKFDEIWDRKDFAEIAPKRQNDSIAFIPISNGCNNNCSYCVVPFTRGRLVCRDHRRILKEAEKVVKNGAKEIWFLGENANDYRSPANPRINFSKLMEMADSLPGNFRIFFTSPHPKNFSQTLIDTLAECKKFSRCLNLPMQSGDDKILKRMNRSYKIKEYKVLIKQIREKMPDIKLSTDIIVGFPGETERQFQNTAKLMEEIKFNWAYISKYSPRAGTAAFLIKDNIPLAEKKRRDQILRKIVKKNVKKP